MQGVTIIEEIEHLRHGVDVFGESGPLCPLVSRSGLDDLERWLVSTLNRLSERAGKLDHYIHFPYLSRFM
jgi:hypothetical protein